MSSGYIEIDVKDEIRADIGDRREEKARWPVRRTSGALTKPLGNP